MDYTNTNDIETANIQEHFRKTNFYTCTFPYINRDTDIYLSTILKAILQDVNQEEIYPQLEYTLNELSMNASKANSKRVYFKSKSLDIMDPNHYIKGIQTFKHDVFNNFKEFEQQHLDSGCFVKIIFSKINNTLKIDIINNSPLLAYEKHRIEQKFKIAKQFDNLEDVIAQEFDSTEGGGFGLIIMLLMLRKVNLGEKSITYNSDDATSMFTLSIPLNIISKKHGDIIANIISGEIKKMPQFPQSISLLQKEIANPNCSFNSIAETISSDPSLSAEVIRIANSPVYRLPNKVGDVKQAVRLIGMLGIKALLYNYGVNKVFQKKYNKKIINKLNHHSYYVALIASYLMQYKKLNRLAEDVYVISLLHDIGKIIINSLSDDLEYKLAEICREKHIPIAVLEDLTEGYNHSLVGAEVAKRWDFPEKYVEAIRYHHIPLEVNDDYRVVTYSVYIGNELYHLLKGNREFNDINFMVLSFFGLENEETFYHFVESLNQEILIPDID